MLTTSEIRKKLSSLIADAGMSLYDLDMPSQSNGVLRVYLAQADGSCSGVDIDTCEMISKKISSSPEFSWLADSYLLEVSSPGINRKLSRADQFEHAVGERVKLLISEFGKNDETLIGVISRCEQGKLDLTIDGSTDVRTIKLEDIRKANVDFLFK